MLKAVVSTRRHNRSAGRRRRSSVGMAWQARLPLGSVPVPGVGRTLSASMPGGGGRAPLLRPCLSS
jgi:hypothetical protein